MNSNFMTFQIELFGKLVLVVVGSCEEGHFGFATEVVFRLFVTKYNKNNYDNYDSDDNDDNDDSQSYVDFIIHWIGEKLASLARM